MNIKKKNSIEYEENLTRYTFILRPQDSVQRLLIEAGM